MAFDYPPFYEVDGGRGWGRGMVDGEKGWGYAEPA